MAQVSAFRRSTRSTAPASNEVHAVQDLDLEIDDGEFVALLGPSGCGKTSTLRMIVGLEEISSGAINFNDKRVNELEPQGRNVAMAFETYALYPNFTIEENLAFPLEVRGVARGRAQAGARRRSPRCCASTIDPGPAARRPFPAASSSGSAWAAR